MNFQHTLDECTYLLQCENYYNVHERLEDLWRVFKKEGKKETLYIKGLTNGATSLELAKRGRIDAAQKVWQTYLKYAPLSKNIQFDTSHFETLLTQCYNKLMPQHSQHDMHVFEDDESLY